MNYDDIKKRFEQRLHDLRSKAGEERDREALELVWRVVGRDLTRAMREYESELHDTSNTDRRKRS